VLVVVLVPDQLQVLALVVVLVLVVDFPDLLALAGELQEVPPGMVNQVS
jgi:hypothetical protein